MSEGFLKANSELTVVQQGYLPHYVALQEGDISFVIKAAVTKDVSFCHLRLNISHLILGTSQPSVLHLVS